MEGAEDAGVVVADAFPKKERMSFPEVPCDADLEEDAWLAEGDMAGRGERARESCLVFPLSRVSRLSRLGSSLGHK